MARLHASPHRGAFVLFLFLLASLLAWVILNSTPRAAKPCTRESTSLPAHRLLDNYSPEAILGGSSVRNADEEVGYLRSSDVGITHCSLQVF